MQPKLGLLQTNNREPLKIAFFIKFINVSHENHQHQFFKIELLEVPNIYFQVQDGYAFGQEYLKPPDGVLQFAFSSSSLLEHHRRILEDVARIYNWIFTPKVYKQFPAK